MAGNRKKQINNNVHEKFFNGGNPRSRKVVVKEFSYRMDKNLYNALAAEPQSKRPIKGAYKQRHRFDSIVLIALNNMSCYTRRITSIIIN